MTRRGALAHFLHAESTGGLALLAATVVALAWANSPFSDGYAGLFDADVRHWVNDGLMTVFFLVVGLEIKRELVLGELRDRKTVALPAMAALGGMVVPALVYLTVNLGDGGEPRGWAVPMATDIAFCVGIMAVLGSRVSSSVKLFLLTLAIVDDIGAILVIALFYGGAISVVPLLIAFGVLAVYAVGQRAGRGPWPVYVVLAVAAWTALSASGVHPTLAGVAVGLLTRVDGGAERVERLLHPWSSLLVVPVFALANAGLPISAETVRAAWSSPVALGVGLGLVMGKLVGVLGATWAGSRLGIGALPTGVRWGEITGVAALAGVGFTVSLFVTGLAFDDQGAEQDATLGILAGSLVAALLGGAILWRTARVEPGEL